MIYFTFSLTLSAVQVSFDAFYFLDVVFILSYRRNIQYRKIKFTAPRNWFFIFLDFLSIIPAELFYSFYYVTNNENDDLERILFQNRTLRIYRIFYFESLVEKTITKYHNYILYMIFLFVTKVILVSQIICCLWVNMKNSLNCDLSSYTCLLWHMLEVQSIVIHNSSLKYGSMTSTWEIVLAALAMFFGLVLIYAYFYPFIFLVSIQLNYARALYYDKYKRLVQVLDNMIKNQSVKEKIIQNFLDSWKNTTNVHQLFENVPLALKKEIFTDIFWDAFSHSDLLRSISRSCKRTLSLVVTKVNYHTGEQIYVKGQNREKMLFLIQGMVQIMAEENEKSPLLSFSSGTVFGESSLFLCTKSSAIIKCMTYCEFQILTMQNLAKVFIDYPKDKILVFKKLKERLKMAKYTQWRKTTFGFDDSREAYNIQSNVEDCVKWIKTQWVAISEGHIRHKLTMKAIEEGQRIPSFHRTLLQPEIKIEFISNYLELFVLSNAFEEKRDAVCLRTNFPWSIDPTASFLRSWNTLIKFVSFFPMIVYPFSTAWLDEYPILVYKLSFVVTTIFLVDVVLKLLTAKKTKHNIITQFRSVLLQKLREPTFYLDILAAFPYQIFIILKYNELKSYEVGLFLYPAILKFHVFVTVKIPLGSYMVFMNFLKNFIIYLVCVYFFAAGLHIYYYSLEVQNGPKENWITRYLSGKGRKNVRVQLVSFINVLLNALGITDLYVYCEKTMELISESTQKYVFFLIIAYFLGNFFGCFIIKIFSFGTFIVLLKRIRAFIESIRFSADVEKQLLKNFKFQWDYEHADNFSSESPILKFSSFDIKKNIFLESIYHTLKICKMFQLESNDFLMAVMKKCSFVGVPAGSIIVTYGDISHTLSIVHRGTCQINSFLVKDTTAGLGWPMAVGPGYEFPVLSTLCGTPVPVGVITITDCELIMIHVNDLVNIFIHFEMLKDVTEALVENNFVEKLQNVKPGLIGVKENLFKKVFLTKDRKESLWSKKLWSIYFFFDRGNRYNSLKFFEKWELFFGIYVILLNIFWPSCFGILAYASHVLLPMLVASQIVIVLNILFYIWTPYYNDNGILVYHPFYTLKHYLNTALTVDLLCFFPFYSIVRYGISDSMEKLPYWTVLFSLFQYYLKFIHVIGFFGRDSLTLYDKYFVHMAKIILFFFITLNIHINFCMFFFAEWFYESPYKIVDFEVVPDFEDYYDNATFRPNESLHEYYIYICYWTISSLNANNLNLEIFREFQLKMSFVLSLIGAIFSYYVYCTMVADCFFTFLGEIIFQEKITSLVKFLEFENADDKVIERVLSYYNYVWSKSRGENLKKTFEQFPSYLHDQLVYPLYRSTLIKCNVFSNANEGFYKILANHLSCVYYSRGSVIIFQNEVQSHLYFLHKGKCFVYDWFLILTDGSLIGDLNHTGVMRNKIYALTHTELLKISSNDFFSILNNFDTIETQYLKVIQSLENFFNSGVVKNKYQAHPVDSRDVLHAFGLESKVFGFEDESYFEETNKVTIVIRKSLKFRSDEKKHLFIIYPGTWKIKILLTFVQIIAFLSISAVPFFGIFGSLTNEAFSVIAILDLCWLLCIIFNFFVGYMDKVKGDVITDLKFIALKYMKRGDGFFIDLLALIPFEILYILTFKNLRDVNSNVVSWLRIFRLFRSIHLFGDIRNESKKLKANHLLIYLHLLLYLLVCLIFLSAFIVIITPYPDDHVVRNPFSLNFRQIGVFLSACEDIV